MYCRNCGTFSEDSATYCTNCGAKLDGTHNDNQNDSNDSSSFGIATLGFFIPIVGLILFLVYEFQNKKPKRAKSAAKGALIGFITRIVLSIIITILFGLVFPLSFINNVVNKSDTSIVSTINNILDDTIDDESESDIADYVDVAFGKFKVTGDSEFPETSLEVTVTNKANKRYSYYIDIKAVDSSGARIDTDTIDVDELNPGQQIHLTAFEFVDGEKIDQFKHADFKVLDIDKFDY